jgi:hypothetical protein
MKMLENPIGKRRVSPVVTEKVETIKYSGENDRLMLKIPSEQIPRAPSHQSRHVSSHYRTDHNRSTIKKALNSNSDHI